MKDIKLSPHFTLAEFTRSATADARGIDNAPTAAHLTNLKTLAANLETVRTLLGNNPILITSAYRNPALNRAVGGSSTSDHAKGLAVDFHCPKFGPDFDVCKKLSSSGLKFDQLLFEQEGPTTWVHLGIGPRLRQQVLSWKKGRGYQNGVVKL